MFIRKKTLTELNMRIKKLEKYSEGYYKKLEDHHNAIKKLDDEQYEPKAFWFTIWDNGEPAEEPKRRKRVDVLQDKINALADALKINIEYKQKEDAHYVAKPVKKGKK